jgi:dolichol-phosphate mannosyltransferase
MDDGASHRFTPGARVAQVEVPPPGALARLDIAVRRPANWLELVRYCTVGAAGYLVNLLAFSAANRWLPYLLAFAVAFVVAATSNFVWNRIWTFRVRHGVPHHQYARFLSVSGCALAIDLVVLAGLVEVAGASELVAAAVAIVVATPISFLGNKLWSFR